MKRFRSPFIRSSALQKGFFALLLLSFAFASRADTQADTLWAEVTARAREMKTLSATLTLVTTLEGEGGSTRMDQGKIYLQKPNFARINVDLLSSEFQASACDGTTLWELRDNNGTHQYRKRAADPKGKNIRFQNAWPIPFFFDPGTPLEEGINIAIDKVGELRSVGVQSTGGESDTILEQNVLQPYPCTVRFFVRPDRLIRRVDVDMPADGAQGAHHYRVELSDIVVDGPIVPGTFAYTPPKDFKEYVSSPENTGLLPVGTTAPDFLFYPLNGGKITLQQAVRRKKAMLLNFWFCDCSACRLEFGHLQRLYATLKSQGFEIVAVSTSDTAERVKTALKTLDRLKMATFPVAVLRKEDRGRVPDQYLSGYPANYLLDNTGHILYRSAGFDANKGLADLMSVLVKLGFTL